jgi:hypothetical protein
MIKIAYYISNYGFGHATRSSAVIKGLLETLPQGEIVEYCIRKEPLERTFEPSSADKRATECITKSHYLEYV